MANIKKERKRPVKLEFQFPMYALNTALEVAEKIERQGNGSLSKSSLAMLLGMSVKSSGFSLKIITAKQFGLVIKERAVLQTTSLTKAIFKPTSEDERQNALAQAFYNIPLFKAVGDKYNGVPLPSGDVLKNILERDFKVPNSRVAEAYSKLLSSAKEANLIHQSEGKDYLLWTRGAVPLAPIEILDRAVTKPVQIIPGKEAPIPASSFSPTPARKAVWEIKIESKDFAGMDPAAIKAALEGFAELARILELGGSKEERNGNTISEAAEH